VFYLPYQNVAAFSSDTSLPSETVSDLTVREREVLRLMATSRLNREIAQSLGLSTRTVELHVSNILSKLHARSRLDAVIKAQRLGYLSPAS
jgi:DNA-binding NarL/FixJ family response regulator